MCLIWLGSGCPNENRVRCVVDHFDNFFDRCRIPRHFPKRYPLTLHHISNKSAIGSERIENGGSEATTQRQHKLVEE
jgi:hypothetical protein